MFLRQLACVLALLTAQFTPVLSAPSPPFALGATWVYRYTVTRTSEAPVVGTLTTRYDGPVTYRGHRYYATVDSDTITPHLTEKDYYEWTHTSRHGHGDRPRRHLRQRAKVG